MFPNLVNNECAILFIKIKKINRFDLIAFKSNEKLKKFYVKRVIGLPGEIIEIKNNKLYINNLKINEKYLKKNSILNFNFRKYLIPKQKYFVLGDNRINSLDSRYFGAIKFNKIYGKIKIIIWPLYKIKYFL